MIKKTYTVKIKAGKSPIVKNLIESEYLSKGPLVSTKEILLEELKFLPAIDFDKQKEIKDYIDDLVFCLVFQCFFKRNGIR